VLVEFRGVLTGFPAFREEAPLCWEIVRVEPESDASLVLILAPAGQDASVSASVLAESGLPSRICPDLPALVAAIDTAACAILAEEALFGADRSPLADWIARQPSWSDFPFLLLTHRGTGPSAELAEMLGNVTVLERPFHPATLAHSARSAVRARKRQREAAAYLQERRQTEERQTLLIRELHHRVKNTLATVQALLGATARSTHSVDEFYRSFSDRVVSLAKTHNLLTEDYWQTASLQEILMNELGPYDDGTGRRIILHGPPVDLAADLAVPTGMALHELTTNAAKYGSLSVPEGRVEINWDIRRPIDRFYLHLEWIEQNGPPVEPPSYTGFGSTLLQRVLTTQCSAEIGFDFDPGGFRFVMNAPLIQTRLVPKY
jgi:two-component sensor histidine kinase